MQIGLDDVIKLLLAVAAGGLVGAERELRDKAAGFRTMILICVGATLFTILSLSIGGSNDPARIAANIVSGVGFLGAGAILRESGRITGLTTASTIWLVAALGMGIGGGHYLLVAAAVGVILIVLWMFPLIEGWMESASELRRYRIVCRVSEEKSAQLAGMFKENGLRVRRHRRAKQGEEMVCAWDAVGRPKNHDQVTAILFADPDVKEVSS